MLEKLPATQIELEEQIKDSGRARALRHMEQNEGRGRPDQNPYARVVFRRWLYRVRDVIEEQAKPTGKPGRYKAHVPMVQGLDPASIAYITIRCALVHCLSGGTSSNCRDLCRTVGRMVYEELVLATFESLSPELYWEISNDLDRRRSQDERHKFRVYQHSATKADIAIPVWSPAQREQVGSWLVEILREVGLVEVTNTKVKHYGRFRQELAIYLTDEAEQVVSQTREAAALALPYHQPCIEPPKDWVAVNDGGYHTEALRRQLPCCINMLRIHSEADRERIKSANLINILTAINHLQQVAWAVNTDVLGVAEALARSNRLDVSDVVSTEMADAPPPPGWLKPDMTKDDMSQVQRDEMRAWKKSKAAWYTSRKLRKVKSGRFYTTFHTAKKYAQAERIYFVYQADFRGRLYAMTTGISPQGSDLQRALLRFADGKPLNTPEAVKWFTVNGANRYGEDKVSFDERIKWVNDNEQAILQSADDPAGTQWWQQADAPFQFLAWCFEYAEWKRHPSSFQSRIPIGFDGSCNGLQHFSAMLRDSAGGRAVNLVPGDKPRDIYREVADVVVRKLGAMRPDDDEQQVYRDKWLAHGVDRKTVKRSVMTLPYGSTRFSCSEYIAAYLADENAPEFNRDEYSRAANFLSFVVWEAIGEVIVSAITAMSWLQNAARALIAAGEKRLEWVAPSGFPVIQLYNDVQLTRISSLLLGGIQLKIGQTGEKPSRNRHRNGVSPNLVHSMDAAHLALTVCECKKRGITSLAMIHDDYGTHAADAEVLRNLIRETFVRMYQTHDPIQDFYPDHPAVPSRPCFGDLAIERVRDSDYFFA